VVQRRLINYDGVIDGSDYTLMDNAYNQQGAQISAQNSDRDRPKSPGVPVVRRCLNRQRLVYSQLERLACSDAGPATAESDRVACLFTGLS